MDVCGVVWALAFLWAWVWAWNTQSFCSGKYQHCMRRTCHRVLSSCMVNKPSTSSVCHLFAHGSRLYTVSCPACRVLTYYPPLMLSAELCSLPTNTASNHVLAHLPCADSSSTNFAGAGSSLGDDGERGMLRRRRPALRVCERDEEKGNEEEQEQEEEEEKREGERQGERLKEKKRRARLHIHARISQRDSSAMPDHRCPCVRNAALPGERHPLYRHARVGCAGGACACAANSL